MSFVNANNYRPRSFSPLQIGPSGLSNSFKTQKKSRKQRTIKNGIVNVDDVRIRGGLGNSNWLKIAKQKLTQRELILLRKRQGTLDRLIIDTIQTFTDPNMNQFNFNAYQTGIRDQLIHPQSIIMRRCSQYIVGVLHKWNGYKPQKDEEIRFFRHYFQRCRHWFDTKKIRIMTIDFWIPIMQLIEQISHTCYISLFVDMYLITACVKFATIAASQFIGNPPLQQKYSNYLCALIMKRVFEGHIKPANARKMWLIPAMAYPIFLRQFNGNLQIVIDTKSRKNKVIRTQYLRCLNSKCDALRNAFDEEMNRRTTTNRSQPSVVSHSNSNRNDNVFASDHVTWYDPHPQDMPPAVTPPPKPCAPICDEMALPLFPRWPQDINVPSNWVFDDAFRLVNDSPEFIPLSAHGVAEHTTVPMPCVCAACVLSPCDLFCNPNCSFDFDS
eukprot:249545_1